MFASILVAAVVLAICSVGAFAQSIGGEPKQAKWFDTSFIHEVRLEMSAEGWETFRADPKETGGPAKATVDGHVLDSPIRVKGKGFSTFISCWDSTARAPTPTRSYRCS